jgi:hypothetical protein
MSRLTGPLFLLLALSSAPASAQRIVTSAGPDRVAVTVYRDPWRSPRQAPNLQWLNGYALVSETRRITLAAGESTIRFEGVAGGIVPQSAVVTGFPDGIVERNRDAYLLSPATLLDRSLGRRVHIRRTSGATGRVREQEAVIRTGADGAVILQTEAGFEALRCTGLAETLLYDRVPAELSARPTLSVRVRSEQRLTATVTLSYISSGFDWQANYVAHLSPDGARAELFAWLTLASTDETSFRDASTQVVAGQVNRTPVPPQPREGGPLQLQCWPHSTTSDIPLEEWLRAPPPPPLPPPPPADTIVVTGTMMRNADLVSSAPIAVVGAEQEELGDLKLYRIPIPVTVASNSQKQVALLQRSDVAVELVYRQRFLPGGVMGLTMADRVLVTRNRPDEGLGLPLPAGGLVVFAGAAGRPLVLGEGHLDDRAVGEDVEVQLGRGTGVTTEVRLFREGDWDEFVLSVTNDRAEPVRFEAEFDRTDSRFIPSEPLTSRDGRPLWAVTVPANGTASLRYRVED